MAEKKTFFSMVSEAFSDFTDKLAKNPQDKTNLYITIAAVASASVIMVGAITGFLLPKDGGLVSDRAEMLKTSEQKYIDAVEENEKLNRRIDELTAQKEELNSELNAIIDYETARDSAKKDMNDVSAQVEALGKQIEEKQNQIKELDAKILDMGGKVTLSPGMYTVGKQISAGEYYVKGDGSLLVSDSQSKLKINTRLTEEAPYTCRLTEGDVIKLETEAVFNAAG